MDPIYDTKYWENFEEFLKIYREFYKENPEIDSRVHFFIKGFVPSDFPEDVRDMFEKGRTISFQDGFYGLIFVNGEDYIQVPMTFVQTRSDEYSFKERELAEIYFSSIDVFFEEHLK